MVGVGILLRFLDTTLWDVLSDEAQFLLGHSNSHPDTVPFLLRSVVDLTGGSLFWARTLPGLAGALSVGVVYWIGRIVTTPRDALLITAIAALWPMHITMSRIAYLDSFQALAWLLTVAVFLQARRTPTPRWIGLLYLTVIITTFVKTQGFLFPMLLGIGLIVHLRTQALRDPLTHTLLLAGIPVIAFILTEPQILYGVTVLRDMGAAGLGPQRLIIIADLWWRYLHVLLLLSILALPWLRTFPWPVWLLCAMPLLMPFLFGPDHKYYTTYTVFWALPVGMMIMRLPLLARGATVACIASATLLTVGPRDLVPHRFLLSFTQEEGYWNHHADEINAFLQSEDVVYVSGSVHHMRWYLTPTVVPTDNMPSTEEIRGIMLVYFSKGGIKPNWPDARELYRDENVILLERR